MRNKHLAPDERYSIAIVNKPRDRRLKLPYAAAATFLEGSDIMHKIKLNANRTSANELIFDALSDPGCLSAYLWDQTTGKLLWSWNIERSVIVG